MESKGEELRKIIDELPDEALQRAEQALNYCMDLTGNKVTIEQAKARARERSRKAFEEHAKRIARGFITARTDVQMTMPDGGFRSSMSAWDDGPVTYQLVGFSGCMFEIYERLG